MVLRPFLFEDAACASYDLPAGAGVEFPHTALPDGDLVELGNTIVRAIDAPDADALARALLEDLPPPANRSETVRANRTGLARVRR